MAQNFLLKENKFSNYYSLYLNRFKRFLTLLPKKQNNINSNTTRCSFD